MLPVQACPISFCRAWPFPWKGLNGERGKTLSSIAGGGDAFASGLIYAKLHGYKPMDMVNFAVASSVIKHTIHGDGNITDDVQSIRNLMNMNFDIKR